MPRSAGFWRTFGPNCRGSRRSWHPRATSAPKARRCKAALQAERAGRLPELGGEGTRLAAQRALAREGGARDPAAHLVAARNSRHLPPKAVTACDELRDHQKIKTPKPFRPACSSSA